MRRSRFCHELCLVAAFVFFCLHPAASRAQQPEVVPAATKPPAFEVASIKPGRLGEYSRDWDSTEDRVSIQNYTLRDLIAYAYNLKSDSQVLRGPDWLGKKHFDITAKVDDADVAKFKTMSRGDVRAAWRSMMQSLLAERFGLQVNHSQQTIPVLALVVSGHEQKLLPAAKDTAHGFSAHNSHVTAKATSMADFADFLTGQPETQSRVVVDRTGLTGGFDFELNWTRDRGNGIPPDAPYPGLLNALREQLGLSLKSDKAAVDVIMVESAKEPEFD